MKTSTRAIQGGIVIGAVTAMTIPFGNAFGQGDGSITANISGKTVTVTTTCPSEDGTEPFSDQVPNFTLTEGNASTGATFTGDLAADVKPGTYQVGFSCNDEPHVATFTVPKPPGPNPPKPEPPKPGPKPNPGGKPQIPTKPHGGVNTGGGVTATTFVR